MDEKLMEMLSKFIGEAYYDKHGQMIFGKQKDGNNQMLLNVRGWGAIQHLFLVKGKPTYDDWEKDAGKFQDDYGKFVADAINEKIERDKSK